MIDAQTLSNSSRFYVVGGTLRRDAPSYVAREADSYLHSCLLRGDYCYVLTARQMGKSSLMVRTAARLRENQVQVAVLDLTALGQNLNVEQWYTGLLDRIGEQTGSEKELEMEWERNQSLGPLQRLMLVIRTVLLQRTAGRLVVFIDEIDAVRSLSFSTDEFFAGIRELYNRRAHDPELGRLSFCLMGVASPSDLIRDTRTTPFNIGRRIELNDFTEAEATALATGLEGKEQTGRLLLRRILYWTGGHPYLTQRLCRAVAEDATVQNTSAVDRVCNDLFLSLQAREHDDNLLFVRDRILRSEVDVPNLLTLYDKILRQNKVRDDESDPFIAILRLSGITRSERAHLKVRNRIYQRVFDRAWVRTNLPGSELRRQKAAYRRGILVAALAVVPVFALGITFYVQQKRLIEEAPNVPKTPAAPSFWASFSTALDLSPRVGSLIVDVGVKNARIFINDREYARTTREGLLRINGIAAGKYSIRVEKPGFQSVTLPVEVKAQSLTPLSFVLPELPTTLAMGSMEIKNAPPGAKVTSDGRDLGVTSETGTFSFVAPPGQHSLRIAKEGFLPDESLFLSVLGIRTVYSAHMKSDVEYEQWQHLKNTTDLSALQAFIKASPTGPFAVLALEKSEELEWELLKTRNDSGVLIALDDFTSRCTGSTCAEAKKRLESLRGEEEDWIGARNTNKIESLQNYLSKYPDGRYSQQAHVQIARLTDDLEVRDIVHRYEQAYNQKNIDQLATLWPTLPLHAKERIREVFKATRSVSMSLSVSSLTVTGDVAKVVCKRNDNMILRNGSASEGEQDSVVFKLLRQGGNWVVESGPY